MPFHRGYLQQPCQSDGKLICTLVLSGLPKFLRISRQPAHSIDLHPAQIARLWCLWSHTFSPAVVLSSVVTHTTSRGVQSKITSAALAESCRFSNVVANLIVNTNSHGQAVKLFKDASTYRTYAGNFLPILQGSCKRRSMLTKPLLQ